MECTEFRGTSKDKPPFLNSFRFIANLNSLFQDVWKYANIATIFIIIIVIICFISKKNTIFATNK